MTCSPASHSQVQVSFSNLAFDQSFFGAVDSLDDRLTLRHALTWVLPNGEYNDAWQTGGSVALDYQRQSYGYLDENISLQSALAWTCPAQCGENCDWKCSEVGGFVSDNLISTDTSDLQQARNHEMVHKEIVDWIEANSTRCPTSQHSQNLASALWASPLVGTPSEEIPPKSLHEIFAISSANHSTNRDLLCQLAAIQLLASTFTLEPIPALPGLLYLSPSRRRSNYLISALRMHSLVSDKFPASGHCARNSSIVSIWPGFLEDGSREHKVAEHAVRQTVEEQTGANDGCRDPDFARNGEFKTQHDGKRSVRSKLSHRNKNMQVKMRRTSSPASLQGSLEKERNGNIQLSDSDVQKPPSFINSALRSFRPRWLVRPTFLKSSMEFVVKAREIMRPKRK